jgi:hypothetical protein
MKKLFLLSVFLMCCFHCFCQYIILPATGDPIESSKCYRNDNFIEYLLKGEYIKLGFDEIASIYKDGKKLDFNELMQKSDEENTVKSNAEKQQTKEFDAIPKPIQTNDEPESIRVCGVEVMLVDLPQKYKWANAMRACPKGWRLPTSKELECLCENKKRIGGFNGKQYWSSDEAKKKDKSISRTMNDCKIEVEDMDDEYSCRCVRDY